MEEKISGMSINSRDECRRVVEIKELNESFNGRTVTVRGFVLKCSCTGKYVFVVLRDDGCTLQCMAEKPAEGADEKLLNEFKSLKKVTHESYVEIGGVIVKQEVEISGCSKKNIELRIVSVCVLSAADKSLPFSMKDVQATIEERERNPALPTVAYHIRLDNRAMDLRVMQTRAVFRVIDGIMFFFRMHLRKNGFIEIKTPKLIESSSEGGANLFNVDYFKRKAYMAQSPQLYKQMAIIGGMKKVYEIGHVYRAEESNINRYLSEFVGLDMEMEISTDYNDVIKLIYSMFVEIFDGLRSDYGDELETIRMFHEYEDIKYGREPVVLTHKECTDLLVAEGVDIKYGEDFNNENEKRLGGIIKRLHGVDIFVIKDYPVPIRPFYTYRNKEEGTTRSYDFILRGEEILSGAQRVDCYNDLLGYVKEHGIAPESLGGYLESFKYGAPPHGGCGIGLERLAKAYFGMTDIRCFSLFPRDPNRLYP
ncbi:aspartyl-tRNA synthetase [Ordospora colligata]|uniref:Probable aspartate--tRNA ligase, cytoplasmic n=1 Tax=Ordospora colligata OC4 TaxID=1354746 RepID=A0A0B2UKK8_9MICR|nr:aspartyl-tRNA synthetase [Ordospora colligata OC4]KHN69577.1 aspartyl-tRNA synthetase [Ordospora colligata OC4]TBU15397.1 aspartyl-tRNA synthetase [Ordospora colligata]TBU15497.1 aspartyl-tRNA synthetase [Ordospora colligata]TBU18593.1 aspartyl-tRNA synthetase [Ordospora colligata]